MKNLWYILILLACSIASFFYGKNTRQKEIANIIENDTASVSIDLPKPVEEKEPEIVFRDTGSHTIKIEYKDTTIFVLVPVPVDTAAIVADYLLQRNYHIDTTINQVNAVIDASIYANKMANIHFQFVNLRTCDPEAFQFRAGAFAGVNDLSPTFIIDYKKYSYSVSYDLIGIEKGFRFGFFRNF